MEDAVVLREECGDGRGHRLAPSGRGCHAGWRSGAGRCSGPSRALCILRAAVAGYHPRVDILDLVPRGRKGHHEERMAWQDLGQGQVDGDVALVAESDEKVMIRGVSFAPDPDFRGEARLRGVKAPEGREEAVACGPAHEGIAVIEVSDVDTHEVGETDDRGRRDANTPFGGLSEEEGGGRHGPSGGGSQGRGGHGVEHT